MRLLLLVLSWCGLSLAYRPELHNDTQQGGCPGRPAFSKVVLCYYEGRASVSDLDPCLCSHLVFTNAARFPASRAASAPMTLDPGMVQAVQSLRQRNPDLRMLARVSGGARAALISSRSAEVATSLARMTRQVGLDGIEVALDWEGARVGGGAQGKQRLVALIKGLRSALLVSASKGGRVKRSSYSVTEEIEDDIPRPTWISGLYIRPNGSVGVSSTTTSTTVAPAHKQVEQVAREPLLLLQLSAKPGVLGKRFDLKPLSKYVDFFTVPTHNLTDDSEIGMTYHHSRLMGLADILNTDSVLDLLTGLGAPASRIIVTVPAAAQRFQLRDITANKPRSPAVSAPTSISHDQVCTLLSQGGWMVERDEDLTAPYAFLNESWIAFDDELSVEIKGKYALLRGLAGVGVWSIDDDDLSNKCGRGQSGLTRALASTLVSLARRTRSAVLQSLVEPLAAANSPLLSPVTGPVTISPYRIVRVVDRTGVVQVVRRDAQNEYECSRQGYYRHPLGCDRFYRCVKFDQRSDDYSVFEYDCPAGLAFDERWEVCVWPGQARAPCDGTSEIRPVPRSKFACSSPGYFADPENCRWFFACMDHRRDGSQLTPYEFRCPYGLGFDEQNLMCNWPWMVPNCGGAGILGQTVASGFGVDQVIRGSYAQSTFPARPSTNDFTSNTYSGNTDGVFNLARPVGNDFSSVSYPGNNDGLVRPGNSPARPVINDFDSSVYTSNGADIVAPLPISPVINDFSSDVYNSNIAGSVQPGFTAPSRPVFTNSRPQFISPVQVFPDAVNEEYQGVQNSETNTGFSQPTFSLSGPSDNPSQSNNKIPSNIQSEFDRTVAKIQNFGVQAQPLSPVVANTNTKVASNLLAQTPTRGSQDFVNQGPVPVFTSSFGDRQSAPASTLSTYVSEQNPSFNSRNEFPSKNSNLRPTQERVYLPQTQNNNGQKPNVITSQFFDANNLQFNGDRFSNQAPTRYLPTQNAPINTNVGYRDRSSTVNSVFNTNIGPTKSTPVSVYGPPGISHTQNIPVVDDFTFTGTPPPLQSVNSNNFVPTGISPTGEENNFGSNKYTVPQPVYGAGYSDSPTSSNFGSNTQKDYLPPTSGAPQYDNQNRRPEFGARIPVNQNGNPNLKPGNGFKPNQIKPQHNSVTILSPDAPVSDLGQINIPDINVDTYSNSVSTTPATGFTVRPTVAGRPSISDIILTAKPVSNEEEEDAVTDTPLSSTAPSTARTPEYTTLNTRSGSTRSRDDDTIKDLLDTYSGRFSGIFDISNNNEQFIQDVIANRNRGSNNARNRPQNNQNSQSFDSQTNFAPEYGTNGNQYSRAQNNNRNKIDFRTTTSSSYDVGVSLSSSTKQPSQDEINIPYVNNGQFLAQNNQESSTGSGFETTSNNIDGAGNRGTTYTPFSDYPTAQPSYSDNDDLVQNTQNKPDDSQENTPKEFRNYNNRFLYDEQTSSQQNIDDLNISNGNRGHTRQGNTAADLNNFNNRFLGNEPTSTQQTGISFDDNSGNRGGTRQGNTAAEFNNFNNRFVEDDQSSTPQSIGDNFGTRISGGTRQGNTAAELNNFNNRFVEDNESSTPQNIDDNFGTRNLGGSRQGSSAADLNNFNNRFIGDRQPSNVDSFTPNTRDRGGNRQGNSATNLNNFGNGFVDDDVQNTQQTDSKFGSRNRGGTRQGISAGELNNFNNRFITDEQTSTQQSVSNSGARGRGGIRQGNTAAELNNFNNRPINTFGSQFDSTTQQVTRTNAPRDQEGNNTPRRGSVRFGGAAEQEATATIQRSQVSDERSGITIISRPTNVNAIPLVEKLEGSTGEGLGRRFDRYGPGGWRAANETLGPDACEREGLFRHPNDCNRFYECFYDSWKERYTIHIFKCPIRLAYDPTISACNWPIDGPGCSGDRLLLHV